MAARSGRRAPLAAPRCWWVWVLTDAGAHSALIESASALEALGIELRRLGRARCVGAAGDGAGTWRRLAVNVTELDQTAARALAGRLQERKLLRLQDVG